MRYLKEYFPYLALFFLGAFAASSFSPFATISRQTSISSIDSESLDTLFPMAQGTTWKYEGWIRQQVGQEQNPPQQKYHVQETIIQHDKAHDGKSQLITIEREERQGDNPPATFTVGYFISEKKLFRIENEDTLNAVRKYLYGDMSDINLISEISQTPTYDFSSNPNPEGCQRIKTKSLSSTYEETFCAGIGPVAMHYTHNGTIDEYSLELTRFATP